MKILRAEHLGMCFGVRDAIALAKQQPGPATVLGQLVHNELVLDEIARHGVQMAQEVEQVRTERVLITAHGASEQRMEQLRLRGHQVVEATCPLVHHAHRELARMVAAGYHPVIVGCAGHVEVRGLTEDLGEHDVILTEDDVWRIRPRDRFGVMAQTTQPTERFRALVERLRDRFPAAEIRVADTICQPTKLRQTAAAELARQCDVVIVVGGARSNNTRELVDRCRLFCPRVFHVQGAADLHATWMAGAATVGITAGTSTPDGAIAAVEEWLREFEAFQRSLPGNLSGEMVCRSTEPSHVPA